MPPDKDAPRSPSIHRSSEISPTDTRGPPRFESINRRDDEDASTTTGTVRRHGPPAIHNDSGSIASYNTAEEQHEQQDDGQQTPTQGGASQPNTSRDSTTPQQQVYSPEPMSTSTRPKKPPMARRNSSKYQAPHKGQEFSADDDPTEYESDVQQHKRSSIARAASGVGPSLRRQPSTLRRRGTAQPTTLTRVESRGEEEEEEAEQARTPTIAAAHSVHDADEGPETSGEEGTILGDADDEDELSDAESFTLKDRQKAINDTHPFGIRIWKPALYKKNRSVEKTAEGDIHSSPGGRVSRWLGIFNLLWTVFFGWWLALATGLGAVVCLALGFMPGAAEYGRVLAGLAWYLFYPFGQFVKLEQDEAYAEEDEGEGRSISEYERWQNGDLEDGRLFFGPLTSRSLVGRRRSSIESADENDSLLGRTRRGHEDDDQRMKIKRRLFGRGQWTLGRVVFFVFFYFLIAPLLLLTSLLCWFMVFWIPMGKVTLLLFYHLRRHPLALSFNADSSYSRGDSSPSSSVLLCTYRAVGLKYWKYTIDGTNIFLINMLGVVLFAIFDYWVLGIVLGVEGWIVNPGFVFALALFSIIPLAYFIGQAVASISAQSSMGVGAAINAFFSTVVEVFLYCVALNQGKGQLVEGSIIGSIFAGILFLPGLSMCFGAIKRKTQRFNVKSAGVTSTMLLFAIIAAFSPTLFYQIYGSHELNCHSCIRTEQSDEDCRRCYFSQVPAIHDAFFLEAVRPYTWLAAFLLFLSYGIGLWFTLRTHAAVIWNVENDEKKGLHPLGTNGSISHHPIQLQPAPAPKQPGSASSKDSALRTSNVKESPLYKRILQQSLNEPITADSGGRNDSRNASVSSTAQAGGSPKPPHLVPPKSSGGDSTTMVDTSQVSMNISALSEQENSDLVRHVAEMAAQAATIAARDATQSVRRGSVGHPLPHHTPRRATTAGHDHPMHQDEAAADAMAGGHDAPNWGRTKSAVILLGATLLYAIIAEILVNTVDVVLESVDIDEKFLGITLFALVPNTTEFLNAISFAMNGNIALSMEIGSAYALQVCLLQIPALVLFSAVIGQNMEHSDLLTHTFNLIFPQWDMVTVILCVFLLSYVYGEGKSNYFKGSILLLTYLVIVVGFYLAGYSSDIELMGIDRFDKLALGTQSKTFQTIGRPRSGRAF